MKKKEGKKDASLIFFRNNFMLGNDFGGFMLDVDRPYE